jgi:hypothetical protein
MIASPSSQPDSTAHETGRSGDAKGPDAVFVPVGVGIFRVAAMMMAGGKGLVARQRCTSTLLDAAPGIFAVRSNEAA